VSAPSTAADARWRRIFPSLGARLVGLFVVLAMAVAITFLLGISELQHGGWREYVRPLIANYGDLLAAEIGSPPDLERARLLTQRLPLHIRIEGPDVDWDSADEARTGVGGASAAASASAPMPEPAARAPRHELVTLPDGGPIPLIVPPPRRGPRASVAASGTVDGGDDAPAPAATPAPRPHAARAGPHRLSLHPELDPSDWRVVRRLPDGSRIAFGLADISHEARARHVGWTTLAVLLLLTAFAYAAVRHMLHPLVALRAGAVRYGQGDFSQPIVPRNRDELGDLAEQINGMAARLHHMLDAKRQLLLAISHELRSPLARARLNAELIDESPERGALLRDLGAMRDLITDLLESERLADVQAGGHAALQTEPTALADIVHAQCDAQAATGEVTLSLADGLPPLALDRTRMRLLLRNLVDNALRHGADAAAPPQVSTRRTPADRRLHLVVRDHGPGMDEAQLQHATEAFYRADSARLRSTGGVGLGLYLCKLVAEAHGGTLSLRNAHPGLEIDASFPAPPEPR
jgi:signal transduction histidine kinase